MPIGRASKGPRVIACGVLDRVSPRGYADNEKNQQQNRVGQVYATDYTLLLDDGARIFVRVWERDGESSALDSAQIGDFVAVWAEAVTGNRGDELQYDAPVTPGDLDRINSALAVATK